MKDYSQFIPNSFGFITKYEIVGDEIHVYTPQTKKGQPHKYPATKEKIAFFESRLENQYKLVVENRDFLKENISKESKRKILPITTIAALVMALVSAGIIAFSSIPVWIPALIGGASLTVGVGGPVAVSQIIKHFDAEMDVANIYLKRRREIESLNDKDKNVTEYLSKSASKRLESSEELRKKDSIDTRFSIDFLDKTTLKDLKKLITRYLISKNIEAEQQFIIPAEQKPKTEKPAAKKKQLVPEQPKH